MKKIAILILLIFSIQIKSNAQKSFTKPKNKLKISSLKHIGTVDERFQSYNIEMCEVIGGDFWVPYELIDSVQKHSGKTGFAALKWKIDPINLYESKLRKLAAALGPAYVRVSGTWANDVYFQNNDNEKLSKAPAGFNNILTRAQWKGVVDYCKAVNGKIVSSFAISDGMHDAKGGYNVEQVKDLIDYTKSIGGVITAAEMFNEPTFASHGAAPKNYNALSYANDFTIFNDFVSKYYPEMMVIGPGSVGEGGVLDTGAIKFDIDTEEIMKKLPKNSFKAYSYHYYGGVSKRCGGNQTPESVLTNDWLSKTEKGLEFYKKSRDKYTPGAPIWLNETAEAACGGDPLASTYVDTFRYLEQLGRLAKMGVQSVMHNTLARSEYGLLDQVTHNPRPNYWAALLWAKLMGTEVFEVENIEAGVDVFAHNLKGTKNGKTMLVINTNAKETTIDIPKNALKYQLTADNLLAKTIKLNGKELKLNADDNLPVLNGEKIKAGTLKIQAHSIVFLTFQNN